MCLPHWNKPPKSDENIQRATPRNREKERNRDSRVELLAPQKKA